jgi:Flp pilus assembly pilin Flp
MPLNHFLRDQRGAVMVEVAIMLSLTLVLVLGSIDFLLLFYQWNAAAKAVQIGARLAAVSDPVASGLNDLSRAVVNVSVPPGAAMPKFIVTCEGRTATCTCNSVRACRGVKGYDSAAMNTVVFGRGSSSCSDAKSSDQVGMCHIFSRITPANVKIVYAQTGLGYAGRPGGPMPTITVSIQNLPFRFYFLGGLIGFRNLQIPASTTSITAEDLSSRAPAL